MPDNQPTTPTAAAPAESAAVFYASTLLTDGK